MYFVIEVMWPTPIPSVTSSVPVRFLKWKTHSILLPYQICPFFVLNIPLIWPSSVLTFVYCLWTSSFKSFFYYHYSTDFKEFIFKWPPKNVTSLNSLSLTSKHFLTIDTPKIILRQNKTFIKYPPWIVLN